MVENQDDGVSRSTMDRRSALKKGALAAGIVAWTTPTVVALTPGSASAALTGCFPSVAWEFVTTGSSCLCYTTANGNPGPGNSCCSNKTYFVRQKGAASCGGTCPGTVTATLISASPSATAGGGAICPAVVDLASCGGTTSLVTLVYRTSCPDGVKYQCTSLYNVDCVSDNQGCFVVGATLSGSPSCVVVP